MTQLAPTSQRWRAGLPRRTVGKSLVLRIVSSHLTYVYLAIVVASFICIVELVKLIVPDRLNANGGRTLGIGTEAWREAFAYAWPTAAVLVLLFLATDRWRPRFIPAVLCFLWGACIATYASLRLNTWAADRLSIIGDGDPATATRAAIFVAPFVEEATKGSVLFLLAVVARYAWANRVSGLVMGALSGIGFAFVENMLYYGQIYRAAAQTYGAVTPDEAIENLAFLRGVMLAFGHPLFTMMIGIGLTVGLRARSRVVRVIAPLVGFVVAVLLHMTFNSVASTASGPQQLLIYIFGYWGLVIVMTIFAIRELLRESRLVRARLTDYARTGQLQAGDPEVMSRVWRRARGMFHGLLTRAAVPTFRMQRAMIELAYLRDSMTRGLVDATGTERERELLATIAELRPRAVVEPYTKTPWPSPPWARNTNPGAPLGSARTRQQPQPWGVPR